MRIAICDHDGEQRRCLSQLLGTAFAERSIPLSVEQYSHGRELLCELRDGVLFDAVMLDLSVDAAETVETARAIRNLPYSGELIFTSDTAEFAVEGYELGAGGYLLKPYSAERLLRQVERLTMAERPRCLTVCHYRTLVRVPYHEIAYIESCNTKCIIHRRDGKEYRVYRQLDDLQTELTDPRFLRCHQSFLVNMDAIVKVDTQFELENGDTVAIRQRELRRIRTDYLTYIHGDGMHHRLQEASL